MTELILIVCVAAFFVALPVIGYRLERKAWNGGYCRECGAPMVGFDNDSGGARGYTCASKRHRHPGCWISYPGIVGDIGERA